MSVHVNPAYTLHGGRAGVQKRVQRGSDSTTATPEFFNNKYHLANIYMWKFLSCFYSYRLRK